MDDSVIRNLLTNRSKLNELSEQIASGKKINKPSDDPGSAITALTAKTSINKIENYITNIENAQSEIDVVDKALQSAIDINHRAKELAIEASNATTGSEQLAAIKTEIDQLTKQLTDLGNTKFGDKYIFGGTVTETAPFETDENGNVRYNGTPSTGTYERKIEISEGVTMAVNLAGESVFGEYYVLTEGTPPEMAGSGFIQTLKTLSNALGASPVDYDEIRSKIDNLSTDLTTLSTAEANIGGLTSRLTMTKNKLEDNSLTFEKVRSSAEDIDLAKAISDLKFQETALEASLQVSARIIQPSLLNYM